MSDVQIREATEADLPAVMQLYAQPGMDDGAVLTTEEAQRIFSLLSTYPDYRLYVALTGQGIVGTFALLIMNNLGHLGSPSGIVEDVVVAPDQHGQGIGRQMMIFARQQCADKGCYKMVLSSNLKRDSAHHFYESLGFEKHGYSFRITP